MEINSLFKFGDYFYSWYVIICVYGYYVLFQFLCGIFM